MRLVTTGVISMMLLLGMVSVASGEKGSGLDQVLHGVNEHYANVTAIQCSFEQENQYLGGENFVQKGTLLIQRPAKMKWDYTSPSLRQFISDGESLWVYHPDEKRAFVMNDLDSGDQARMFGFILGLEDVRSQFTVTLLPEPGEGGRIRLQLVPKEAMAGVDKIWVEVEPEKHAIVSVTFDDGMGNLTVTRLTDVQTNPEIPTGEFTFEAPDGVEILPYN